MKNIIALYSNTLFFQRHPPGRAVSKASHRELKREFHDFSKKKSETPEKGGVRTNAFI
jgi:hypothetical protein